MILIVIFLYLNFAATYHIFRSGLFTKEQRKYQLILIWGLPFIGSILVIVFILSQSEYIQEPKKQNGLPPAIVQLLTLSFLVGSHSGLTSDEGLSGDNGFAAHSHDGAGEGGGDGDG